jgi:bifunctional non-homologous end joining protein LigD
VSSFAALVQSIGSKRFAAQAFVAFDLMHLNGESWLERPLVARKAQLAALVGALAPKSPVRYGEHLEGDGRLILEQAARLGVEGLVSKRRDRPYRPGGGDWLKVKLRFSDEFVVVGWLAHATGKQAVGALVLAFHDGGQLVYVGRTGTGFTAKAASALWEVLQPLATSPPPFAKALPAGQKRGVEWVVPRLVAQVDYLGWTTDRLLRAAAFKGLREDKPPGDVGRPPGYPA